MAYLPKHKQAAKDKLKELGGSLLDPKTGLNFSGKFIQDYLGRFFKGDKLTRNSEPLEYAAPSHGEENNDTRFISQKVTPSSADYAKGVLKRFFCKDSRTNKIIEVEGEKYKLLKKESKLYRRVIRIEWYITGDPEDQIIGGYLYPGTKAKNQDVINKAEKILPGIGAQILKDPSQFVRK
jgi:hypothetical protein